MPPTSPSDHQIERARAVTRWYLAHYYGTADDVGVASMFCDPSKVGYFAVRAEDFVAGEPVALFRLLITTAMFQRRQDLQIMRVLRGITAPDAAILGSADALLALADDAPCPYLRSTVTLKERCDLQKLPESRRGVCGARPELPCHLKRHTELLKRYGHFGKVPTSLALAVREAGASDLGELYARVRSEEPDPVAAAQALEAALSRAWRVSTKIAHMYLSMLTNPELCPAHAGPWSAGVDWTRFVVIDSNVDLFLRAVGYAGRWTYEARLSFLLELAQAINLGELRPGLTPYNPRIVQQALYLFMSATNRRFVVRDCWNQAPTSCRVCPTTLSELCARGKAV